MKRKYWFKAHKTGYGWYPSSWQGWVSVITYVGILIHAFLSFAPIATSYGHLAVLMLPRVLMATAVLIIITYLMGESITWGLKGKKQHEIP